MTAEGMHNLPGQRAQHTRSTCSTADGVFTNITMEFYYTYSSMVNPPEFQRYRIYTENGKIIFYHEKREGDKVFLTEEDITVSGELELTTEEWETIWNCLIGGTVKNRTESTAAGGSGPWFYLYWNGDKNQCQKFNFADLQKETVFEEFCADLISR